MNVIQPAMLWLLAAIAIPIIIHLYNRKRAVRRPFPAIELLLRSNRKLARKLKVRQMLLLAVRIGVFALIPLALARPFVHSDLGTTLDERLPAAVVLVVDDSASMAVRAAGSSAWERALDAAGNRLDDLRDVDEAALVFAVRPDDTPFSAPTNELGAVAEELEGRSLSQARGDLRRALEIARDIVVTSELPVRKVVVYTDRTRGSWPDPLGPEIFHGIADVELVDVGVGDAPNVSLRDVVVAADPTGVPGGWEITATIAGYGLDDGHAVEVDLLVDDSVVATETATLTAKAKAAATGATAPAGAAPAGTAVAPAGAVAAPAGAAAGGSEGGSGDPSPRDGQGLGDGPPPPPSATLRFAHVVENPGETVRGVVRLRSGGSLALDDERAFLISGARDVRTLLVNGDPRAQALQDEVFFLEKALRPSKRSRSGVVPRTVSAERLSALDLERSDVVVLANVASLEATQIAALTEFVRAGGGLLFTVGDRVEPTTWNQLFVDLLPKPLRNRKKLSDLDDPDALITQTRIDKLDLRHAAMRPFGLPGGESLQQVRVASYMLLEPDARNEARVVASYADGAPALVERSVGAGRVMLFTSTIDRDWSHFPLSKAYVVATQRIVAYLARRGSGVRQAAHVGEPHELATDGFAAQEVSVLLDGVPVQRFGADDLALDPTPAFVPPRAGLYTVAVTENGVTVEDAALSFVAAPDPDELDTRTLATDDLAALWAAPPPDDESDSAYAAAARERQLPLWPILLLGALILLYLETLIGFRRSFLRRMGRLFTGRGEDERASSLP